eukprot:425519-Lingulodinium_polyedra.AAC.1
MAEQQRRPNASTRNVNPRATIMLATTPRNSPGWHYKPCKWVVWRALRKPAWPSPWRATHPTQRMAGATQKTRAHCPLRAWRPTP